MLSILQTPFIPDWSSPGTGLRPFAAEVWLIVGIVGVLITPFFTRKSSVPTTLVALVACLVGLLTLLVRGANPADVGSHFGGMFTVDGIAVLWRAMLLLFVVGVILMRLSTRGDLRANAVSQAGDAPEYFVLLLGATLGMSLMGMTSNLLMIYLSLELASLPSYVLAGFRKTSGRAAEAALKYVLFGSAASAVMVYGLSLLYGVHGTLSVPEIAAGVASGQGNALSVFGGLALLVGLAFKISAAPLHVWGPDVFEGAQTEIGAFLAVASKGAGLVMLARLMTIFVSAGVDANVLSALAWLVAIVGAITTTVGNTGAFVQTNVKRLLGYSSIAQAGYMICGLAAITVVGSDSRGDAFTAVPAVMVYLAVYLFMTLGVFTVAGIVSRETGDETLTGFAGLGRRHPLLAASMCACLVSLIGLPPLAGFAAKFGIMYVLAARGGWWWTIVGVVGVNTVLSLYYYLRVARMMYFVAPASDIRRPTNPIGLAIATACGLVLILLLPAFSPLQRIAVKYGVVETADQMTNDEIRMTNGTTNDKAQMTKQ